MLGIRRIAESRCPVSKRLLSFYSVIITVDINIKIAERNVFLSGNGTDCRCDRQFVRRKYASSDKGEA